HRGVDIEDPHPACVTVGVVVGAGAVLRPYRLFTVRARQRAVRTRRWGTASLSHHIQSVTAELDVPHFDGEFPDGWAGLPCDESVVCDSHPNTGISDGAAPTLDKFPRLKRREGGQPGLGVKADPQQVIADGPREGGTVVQDRPKWSYR